MKSPLGLWAGCGQSSSIDNYDERVQLPFGPSGRKLYKGALQGAFFSGKFRARSLTNSLRKEGWMKVAESERASAVIQWLREAPNKLREPTAINVTARGLRGD